MALDALPPDQRAVVQLVLQQGRSYDEIAGLLGIGAAAVRDRAQTAIDALAPGAGERLSRDTRGAIADYLLGQLPFSHREVTRAMLADSSEARAWAHTISAELQPASREPLPEVPDPVTDTREPEPHFEDEPAAAAPLDEPEFQPFDDFDDFDSAPGPLATLAAEPAAFPREPSVADRSSKTGGLLLIGGIVALVVVVLVLLLTGGDDKKDNPATGTNPPTTAGTTPQPTVLAQINLKAGPAGEKALGIVQVFRQGKEIQMALVGEKVAPNDGKNAYAVWLYNSQKDAKRLGFTPLVGEDGRLGGVQALPAGAEKFKELIVTRETEDTKTPGPIVLRGALKLS